MDWTLVIIPLAIVIIFWLMRSMSLVSAEAARQHLANGALIIDVRSPEEFSSGSVRKAINVPLGELAQKTPGKVRDKNQVLLVHCLSGGRSAIAVRQLKSMGYPNAHNLGSLSRARTIAESARQR